jgi:hypothetical protein
MFLSFWGLLTTQAKLNSDFSGQRGEYQSQILEKKKGA